jgi:hypothetical protein
LQQTQQELDQTQESLVQQRVLLDAHIRAEAQFHTASKDITSLLADSLKDVKGLHQRIGMPHFMAEYFSVILLMIRVCLFVSLFVCLFVCLFFFVLFLL